MPRQPAAFGDQRVLSQHPVHRGHRTQIDALVEQLSVDLQRREIDEPVAGEHLNDPAPFGIGEFVGRLDGRLGGVGRDILSRVLYGVRASWFAALGVVIAGLVFGGTIGLIAGSAGGRIDSVLMRITDLFLALPAPVMAIAIGAALGPGFVHTLLAVSVVWWLFYARIVRGEVRRLAARPHMEAARLSGTGPVRRVLRHLLPGVLPTAVVTGSLDIGALILTLAGLSFLGLGQVAPAPELGADSARNLSFLLQYWWVPVMPGLAVMVLALIGNVAGDGVRNLLERN